MLLSLVGGGSASATPKSRSNMTTPTGAKVINLLQQPPGSSCSLDPQHAQSVAQLGEFQHFRSFLGCDRVFLSHLRDEMEVRIFQPQMQVVTEGDPPSDVFLLRRGQVRYSVHGSFVRTVNAGDVFGEVACLMNVRNVGTFVTEAICDIRVISQKLLLRALKAAVKRGVKLQTMPFVVEAKKRYKEAQQIYPRAGLKPEREVSSGDPTNSDTEGRTARAAKRRERKERREQREMKLSKNSTPNETSRSSRSPAQSDSENQNALDKSKSKGGGTTTTRSGTATTSTGGRSRTTVGPSQERLEKLAQPTTRTRSTPRGGGTHATGAGASVVLMKGMSSSSSSAHEGHASSGPDDHARRGGAGAGGAGGARQSSCATSSSRFENGANVMFFQPSSYVDSRGPASGGGGSTSSVGCGGAVPVGGGSTSSSSRGLPASGPGMSQTILFAGGGAPGGGGSGSVGDNFSSSSVEMLKTVPEDRQSRGNDATVVPSPPRSQNASRQSSVQSSRRTSRGSVSSVFSKRSGGGQLMGAEKKHLSVPEQKRGKKRRREKDGTMSDTPIYQRDYNTTYVGATEPRGVGALSPGYCTSSRAHSPQPPASLSGGSSRGSRDGSRSPAHHGAGDVCATSQSRGHTGTGTARSEGSRSPRGGEARDRSRSPRAGGGTPAGSVSQAAGGAGGAVAVAHTPSRTNAPAAGAGIFTLNKNRNERGSRSPGGAAQHQRPRSGTHSAPPERISTSNKLFAGGSEGERPLKLQPEHEHQVSPTTRTTAALVAPVAGAAACNSPSTSRTPMSSNTASSLANGTAAQLLEGAALRGAAAAAGALFISAARPPAAPSVMPTSSSSCSSSPPSCALGVGNTTTGPATAGVGLAPPLPGLSAGSGGTGAPPAGRLLATSSTTNRLQIDTALGSPTHSHASPLSAASSATQPAPLPDQPSSTGTLIPSDANKEGDLHAAVVARSSTTTVERHPVSADVHPGVALAGGAAVASSSSSGDLLHPEQQRPAPDEESRTKQVGAAVPAQQQHQQSQLLQLPLTSAELGKSSPHQTSGSPSYNSDSDTQAHEVGGDSNRTRREVMVDSCANSYYNYTDHSPSAAGMRSAGGGFHSTSDVAGSPTSKGSFPMRYLSRKKNKSGHYPATTGGGQLPADDIISQQAHNSPGGGYNTGSSTSGFSPSYSQHSVGGSVGGGGPSHAAGVGGNVSKNGSAREKRKKLKTLRNKVQKQYREDTNRQILLQQEREQSLSSRSSREPSGRSTLCPNSVNSSRYNSTKTSRDVSRRTSFDVFGASRKKLTEFSQAIANRAAGGGGLAPGGAPGGGLLSSAGAAGTVSATREQEDQFSELQPSGRGVYNHRNKFLSVSSTAESSRRTSLFIADQMNFSIPSSKASSYNSTRKSSVVLEVDELEALRAPPPNANQGAAPPPNQGARKQARINTAENELHYSTSASFSARTPRNGGNGNAAGGGAGKLSNYEAAGGSRGPGGSGKASPLAARASGKRMKMLAQQPETCRRLAERWTMPSEHSLVRRNNVQRNKPVVAPNREMQKNLFGVDSTNLDAKSYLFTPLLTSATS